MKKILLLTVICLSFIASYAQPPVNRAGPANTVVDSRLGALYNFYTPRYLDTTSANLQKGIDSCGALIFTYLGNQLWKRDCNPKKWTAIGSGSGVSGIHGVYPDYGLISVNDSTLRVDTTLAGLTTWALTKKKIDSLGALIGSGSPTAGNGITDNSGTWNLGAVLSDMVLFGGNNQEFFLGMSFSKLDQLHLYANSVNIPDLGTVVDTTTYKPVVQNSAGKLFKSYWQGPGGGGGTGGIGEVVAGYGLINTNDSTLRVDSSWAGVQTKIDALRQYDSLGADVGRYRRKQSQSDYFSYEASPYLMTAQWELRNDTVWTDHWRDGSWALSLNDTLFVGNGWWAGVITTVTDSIMYSVDGGVTYSYYGDMPFAGHSITVIQSPDGYVYFCGNDSYATATQRKSVYRTRNLRDFTLMTNNWEIGDRMLTGGFADDNGYLYIMGGQVDVADSSTGRYDVWRSVNNGANWTKIQESVANQFLKGNINGAVLYSDERVYVFGGGLQAASGAQRTFRSTVYSISIGDIANGAAWVQEASMPYAAQYKTVIEWDGKKWCIAGNTVDGNSKNVAFMDKAGVWHSYNNFVGVKPTDATFSNTHAAAGTVHKGLLYLISGNDMNNTFRMRRSTAEFPEGFKQLVGSIIIGNEGEKASFLLNLDDTSYQTASTFFDIRAHNTSKSEYARIATNNNIGLRINSIDNVTGLTGLSLNDQYGILVGHSGNPDGYANGIGFYQFGTNYMAMWLRQNGHVVFNNQNIAIPADESPFMIGGLTYNPTSAALMVVWDSITKGFYTQPIPTGGGGASDWGDIGGTITDQADLIEYLQNNYVDRFHTTFLTNDLTYDTLSRWINDSVFQVKSLSIARGNGITINKTLTDSTAAYEIAIGGTVETPLTLTLEDDFTFTKDAGDLIFTGFSSGSAPTGYLGYGASDQLVTRTLAQTKTDLGIPTNVASTYIDIGYGTASAPAASNLRIQANASILYITDPAGKTLTFDYSGLSASRSFTFPDLNGQFLTTTATQTVTNKRITARVGTTASSSTPTIDADSYDFYTITALAANATFAAPPGTPTGGQTLLVRIKDNGTARTLSWNAIFRASTDFALPTTTVINKTMYVQFIYNATDSVWDCIGLTEGF
jgi:hypothetical protein